MLCQLSISPLARGRQRFVRTEELGTAAKNHIEDCGNLRLFIQLGHEYDATDDCCADSRDKDGTFRTILGLLRERMDVRRSKIDHRLNGGIQAFKRHDKRTADDNRRPFASVESQPRAKHNYCNGSSEMDAHVPLALHRRGNA